MAGLEMNFDVNFDVKLSTSYTKWNHSLKELAFSKHVLFNGVEEVKNNLELRILFPNALLI